MKYLVLIYDSEQLMADMPKGEMEAFLGEYGGYTDALRKAGVFVAGEGLQPTNTATTVRTRHGKTLHTDGPFAETKEALGGFYLIDVPNLDEALKWAAKCPSARIGSIEVRPVMAY
jgi:hypothetical protein